MSKCESADFPADCEAVVRALWDYLDGEVGPNDLAEIDAHLERCEYCRDHLDFERRLVEQLIRLRREPSDPVALRAKVLTTLQEAGYSSGGSNS